MLGEGKRSQRKGVEQKQGGRIVKVEKETSGY